MGHHKVIIIFGILSFIGWLATVRSVENVRREIGFHRKYYPSKYVMPNRKIRKIFNLKKREIPKWVYKQLFMAVVYIGLFITFTVMYLLSENKLFIAQIFFRIYGLVMCGHMLYVMIFLFIFRRRK